MGKRGGSREETGTGRREQNKKERKGEWEEKKKKRIEVLPEDKEEGETGLPFQGRLSFGKSLW